MRHTAQASGAFWYEAYDAGNDAYYYVHSITQESRWDAPLWMEYMDEDTHASYYVNSYTSSSQVRACAGPRCKGHWRSASPSGIPWCTCRPLLELTRP